MIPIQHRKYQSYISVNFQPRVPLFWYASPGEGEYEAATSFGDLHPSLVRVDATDAGLIDCYFAGVEGEF